MLPKKSFQELSNNTSNVKFSHEQTKSVNDTIEIKHYVVDEYNVKKTTGWFKELLNFFVPSISDGVRKIGQQMIDNPLEWQQTEFYFVNLKNPDIRIWSCSGISYIKINGFEGLSYTEKVYLNKCIKMSIANKLIKK